MVKYIDSCFDTSRINTPLMRFAFIHKCVFIVDSDLLKTAEDMADESGYADLQIKSYRQLLHDRKCGNNYQFVINDLEKFLGVDFTNQMFGYSIAIG